MSAFLRFASPRIALPLLRFFASTVYLVGDRFPATPSLIGSSTMPNVEMAMTVRTMCPMNCHPTFCGMLVEVDDGKLKTVSGDKDNPVSQGFLCVRGRATSASRICTDVRTGTLR
jgi:anaerobic selenocysteine-containing dehydrogenase